ncbi:MAG: Unknown protein [uncultured Sulfurovum sp.]|uniref:TIR domain-containing protein n=1 Tax=uncultured Sulfurovum sp. TaxID=269237 RepID=A0A6S6TMJ4_9BACT|nr:MAG: Unknown protein [uncultured Sulfurovum sp.]
MNDNKKIFISYSHTDEAYMKIIQSAITGNSYHNNVFTDRSIKLGKNWHNIILDEITNSDLVLLLISTNFFNSKYIKEIEMPLFIRQCEEKQTHIIPVLLTACSWDTYDWLSGKGTSNQGFPKDMQPLSSFSNESFHDYGRCPKIKEQMAFLVEKIAHVFHIEAQTTAIKDFLLDFYKDRQEDLVKVLFKYLVLPNRAEYRRLENSSIESLVEVLMSRQDCLSCVLQWLNKSDNFSTLSKYDNCEELEKSVKSKFSIESLYILLEKNRANNKFSVEIYSKYSDGTIELSPLSNNKYKSFYDYLNNELSKLYSSQKRAKKIIDVYLVIPSSEIVSFDIDKLKIDEQPILKKTHISFKLWERYKNFDFYSARQDWEFNTEIKQKNENKLCIDVLYAENDLSEINSFDDDRHIIISGEREPKEIREYDIAFATLNHEQDIDYKEYKVSALETPIYKHQTKCKKLRFINDSYFDAELFNNAINIITDTK